MSNNNDQYEYMNEASINSELMCSICKKPFSGPVSTPCDHTFCRECIQQWIEKNNKSCPTCRHQINSIDKFTQASRPLRNMLDRLLIKCLTCEQTGLQRDNFNDHIDKVCLKVTAPCSAADIKCPWTGLREELQTHLITCQFEPLRSLLTQLITNNQQLNTDKQQLNEQTKQHTIQINELTSKVLTMSNVQPSPEKINENESNSTIELSQQKLTDRDLTNVIQRMMNKQCTILQLQGNVITSQGVQTLSDTILLNNSTLKQLHLGSNCITDRGVQHLADMLKTNGTLTDLWLYNNQITDRGVQYLASILASENRTLKYLDLQWNKLITNASVSSLVRIFEDNRILERLNLRKCDLSVVSKMQLLQAIAERDDFKLIV